MPVRRAEIELAAVLASDEAMARLGVPAGHPLVNGTQTGYRPEAPHSSTAISRYEPTS
jgi:hypothetical protein